MISLMFIQDEAKSLEYYEHYSLLVDTHIHTYLGSSYLNEIIPDIENEILLNEKECVIIVHYKDDDDISLISNYFKDKYEVNMEMIK